MDSDWKQRAEALFFNDEKSIVMISRLIGVSVRSVSKHLNGLTRYAAEIDRRKKENQNRTEYYRNWKRKSREAGRYSMVGGETIRAEHETAVKILSRERYFK